MDKKLQLIKHLYGEADDPNVLRELLEDEDLNHEYQELSEAKFWLDHTTHDRPDQAVLFNIFAAAEEMQAENTRSEENLAQENIAHQNHTGDSQESSYAPPQLNRLQRLQQHIHQNTRHNASPAPKDFRADRAPVAHQPQNRRRLYGSLTAVLTIIIFAGIGYQFFQPQNALFNNPAQGVFSQKSLSADEASLEESLPSALAEQDARLDDGDKKLEFESEPALVDLARETSALNAGGFSVADTSLPNWNDDHNRILGFQRRIDMLMQQNQDLAWDEAAVPLELLPSGRPANPGLLQAGSRKTNTGN